MSARPIQKGMVYVSWTCFSDDGVARVKAHQTCVDIGHVIDLNDSDWEHGPPLADMDALDIWRWAEEAECDLAEVAAVWGTKEEAVARKDAFRDVFWRYHRSVLSWDS